MPKKSKQCVMFEKLVDKPVFIKFTAPDQSSDSGVLLLKAVDEKMGLSNRLAAALRDSRQVDTRCATKSARCCKSAFSESH